MGFNSILAAVFQGYRSVKKDEIKHKEYEWLQETPYLHSSQYLKDLYKQASNKEQEDLIIDHINRFKVYEIGNYTDIYDDYIDKRR